MSNQWTPPRPPTSSEFPRQPTDGIDALLLKIEGIKRELSDATNGLLRAAGIGVSPDGMRIDSGLTVTGNTRIEGTLDLPAGIIGNEALSNPVVPGVFYESADGWATPGSATYGARATATITVPAGFTSCVVIADAWASAENSQPDSTSELRIRPNINGLPGASNIIRGIASGSLGSGQSLNSRLLTGLTPGGTFPVSTEVRTLNVWAAGSSNIAVISGTLLWFR